MRVEFVATYSDMLRSGVRVVVVVQVNDGAEWECAKSERVRNVVCCVDGRSYFLSSTTTITACRHFSCKRR